MFSITIDPLIDVETEKLSREIFSQLTAYENGSHTGVTFLLYAVVICGKFMPNLCQIERTI